MAKWSEKLAELLERIEERKKNTKKAKEELATIMEMLSNAIPDAVTGYATEKFFHAKASWLHERDKYWFYVEGMFYFLLENGYVKIGTQEKVYDEYGNVCCSVDYYPSPMSRTSMSFGPSRIDDFDYIDFEKLVPALIEFVKNISEIATFKKKKKILTDIREAVEKVVNGDDDKKQIEKAG